MEKIEPPICAGNRSEIQLSNASHTYSVFLVWPRLVDKVYQQPYYACCGNNAAEKPGCKNKNAPFHGVSPPKPGVNRASLLG